MADERYHLIVLGLGLLFLSFVAFLSVNYGLEVWEGSSDAQGALFAALLAFAFACLLRVPRWRLLALSIGAVATVAVVVLALR